jgi:hypothetical protein
MNELYGLVMFISWGENYYPHKRPSILGVLLFPFVFPFYAIGRFACWFGSIEL